MAKYKPGDRVKAQFTDDETGDSELLWVNVRYSNDDSRLIVGWLDTWPTVLTKLKGGQEIKVRYDLVREHTRFEVS